VIRNDPARPVAEFQGWDAEPGIASGRIGDAIVVVVYKRIYQQLWHGAIAAHRRDFLLKRHLGDQVPGAPGVRRGGGMFNGM
jgi:hypothetical protein